jgi:hypothetical protein
MSESCTEVSVSDRRCVYARERMRVRVLVGACVCERESARPLFSPSLPLSLSPSLSLSLSHTHTHTQCGWKHGTRRIRSRRARGPLNERGKEWQRWRRSVSACVPCKILADGVCLQVHTYYCWFTFTVLTPTRCEIYMCMRLANARKSVRAFANRKS